METQALTPPSKVAFVVTLGSRWKNDNRGGFTFGIENMPSDIEYFIVRPMDLGLEMFLSQLLAALTSDREVRVEYVNTNVQPSGKYEGDVIAIHSN